MADAGGERIPPRRMCTACPSTADGAGPPGDAEQMFISVVLPGRSLEQAEDFAGASNRSTSALALTLPKLFRDAAAFR